LPSPPHIARGRMMETDPGLAAECHRLIRHELTYADARLAEENAEACLRAVRCALRYARLEDQASVATVPAADAMEAFVDAVCNEVLRMAARQRGDMRYLSLVRTMVEQGFVQEHHLKRGSA